MEKEMTVRELAIRFALGWCGCFAFGGLVFASFLK